MFSWLPWLICCPSYLDNYSGLIIESILEKPWPTLAILSEGSLNGSLPHGMYCTYLPYKSMTSLAHEAHEVPPNGFLVNIASSSLSLPYLLMNRSYIFFKFFSKSFKAFLVSFLSANYFDNYFTISFNRSIKLCSKAFTVSMSAFKRMSSINCLLQLANSSFRANNSFSRFAILSNICLIKFSSILLWGTGAAC